MVVLRTLTIAAPVVITVVAKSGDAADTTVVAKSGDAADTRSLTRLSSLYSIICKNDDWCPNGWKCGYKVGASDWDQYHYYVDTCSGPLDPRRQHPTPGPDHGDDIDFDRRLSTNMFDFAQHNAEIAKKYWILFDVQQQYGPNVRKMCAQESYYFCGVVPRNMGTYYRADAQAAERWVCENPLTDCPAPHVKTQWQSFKYVCEDVNGMTKDHKHCVLKIKDEGPDIDPDFDRALDAVKTKGDAALDDKVVVV